MDVSGFPTRQAGKTRTEAYTTGRQLSDPTAQRAPSRLWRPFPNQVASLRPREGGSGLGAQATSGHQLSGLFCLPNSSAVSEPEVDSDLSPKALFKGKPSRSHPVPALQTPALASTRAHTQQEFAE